MWLWDARLCIQEQQHAIRYLREENRILRAHLGRRRLRLNDDQRRSLAAKARHDVLREKPRDPVAWAGLGDAEFARALPRSVSAVAQYRLWYGVYIDSPSYRTCVSVKYQLSLWRALAWQRRR